jgi:uncharacterized protein (DUF433 family)
VVGRYYAIRDEPRKLWKPLIKLPEREPPWLLSFRNLAEAHVLATLRRRHGISMKTVRRSIEYVERHFGDPHPLVNPRMLTDGVSLFMSHYGKLEQVSQDGQFAIREVLQASLHRLEWGPFGAFRLYPFTRGGGSFDAPRLVVIDPKISFGKPVIAGTRIPTSAIFDRWAAGDSVQVLAEDFERPIVEIEEAIRCEQLKDVA